MALFAAVALVVVLAGVVLVLVLRSGPGPAVPTPPPVKTVPVPSGVRLIAVLPFRTDSAREDLAAIAAGTSALARRHLFCIRGLSVLTAQDTACGDENDLRELFTRAGREALVAAKVEEGAAGIRIEAELRKAASSRPLGPYEGTFEELGLLAERLALDVAEAMGVAVSVDERRAVESCRPGQPASVMRLGMAMTVGQMGRATELCEQAIAQDRNFSLLYVELARIVGDSNPDRGSALLEEASRLDPDHADPYWQLAMLYVFRFSGKSSAALALCEQAIARAPAFGQARVLHGNFLGFLGAGPAEREERKIAIRLLPGSAHAWANEGKVLAREGDHAGAVTAFEKALSIDDAHADALEGISPSALVIGKHSLALRWAEKRMDVESPKAGEDAAGDETRFLSAARDAVKAATAIGDRVAADRAKRRALAVDPEFKI